MRDKNQKILLMVCLLLLTGVFLTACSSGGALEGKTILEDRCVECHNLSRVKSASMTREEWSRNIDRMIAFGAELTSEERDLLLDYLEITYP